MSTLFRSLWEKRTQNAFRSLQDDDGIELIARDEPSPANDSFRISSHLPDIANSEGSFDDGDSWAHTQLLGAISPNDDQLENASHASGGSDSPYGKREGKYIPHVGLGRRRRFVLKVVFVAVAVVLAALVSVVIWEYASLLALQSASFAIEYVSVASLCHTTAISVNFALTSDVRMATRAEVEVLRACVMHRSRAVVCARTPSVPIGARMEVLGASVWIVDADVAARGLAMDAKEEDLAGWKLAVKAAVKPRYPVQLSVTRELSFDVNMTQVRAWTSLRPLPSPVPIVPSSNNTQGSNSTGGNDDDEAPLCVSTDWWADVLACDSESLRATFGLAHCGFALPVRLKFPPVRVAVTHASGAPAVRTVISQDIFAGNGSCNATLTATRSHVSGLRSIARDILYDGRVSVGVRIEDTDEGHCSIDPSLLTAVNKILAGVSYTRDVDLPLVPSRSRRDASPAPECDVVRTYFSFDRVREIGLTPSDSRDTLLSTLVYDFGRNLPVESSAGVPVPRVAVRVGVAGGTDNTSASAVVTAATVIAEVAEAPTPGTQRFTTTLTATVGDRETLEVGVLGALLGGGGDVHLAVEFLNETSAVRHTLLHDVFAGLAVRMRPFRPREGVVSLDRVSTALGAAYATVTNSVAMGVDATLSRTIGGLDFLSVPTFRFSQPLALAIMCGPQTQCGVLSVTWKRSGWIVTHSIDGYFALWHSERPAAPDAGNASYYKWWAEGAPAVDLRRPTLPYGRPSHPTPLDDVVSPAINARTVSNFYVHLATHGFEVRVPWTLAGFTGSAFVQPFGFPTCSRVRISNETSLLVALHNLVGYPLDVVVTARALAFSAPGTTGVQVECASAGTHTLPAGQIVGVSLACGAVAGDVSSLVAVDGHVVARLSGGFEVAVDAAFDNKAAHCVWAADGG